MTTKVNRDQLFFAFGPDLQPAIRVRQGEEVILETHDCFEGQIKTVSDLVNELDWGHVNPATGPVYVEGAKPGDVLRVDLLEMKVGPQSSMVTIPGEGALGDVITQIGDAKPERPLDFHRAVVDLTAGEQISMSVRRGEEKLTLALTLGKDYRQDEALDWGYLTRPEESHRLRKTAAAPMPSPEDLQQPGASS